MRWFVALIPAVTGLMVGLTLRRRLRRQVEVLRQICLFLRQMRTRTAYLHTPFPGLVSALCGEYPALTFLSDCTMQCAAGVAFPVAWRTAVGQFRRRGAVTSEVGRLLSRLADSVCGADVQSVDGVLAMYEQTLTQRLTESERCSRSGGQTRVQVCAGLGLLVGILII